MSVLYTSQFAALQRLYQAFAPLHLIPYKSLFGSTVRSVKTVCPVQWVEPSIIFWRSNHASVQLQLLTLLWSPQSLTAVTFIFDFPRVSGSPHLDRRYLITAEISVKCRANRQTCSHVEGMFLQLRFQPDFLGQILESPSLLHAHTHTRTQLYPKHTPQSTVCIFSYPGFYRRRFVAMLSEYFFVCCRSQRIICSFLRSVEPQELRQAHINKIHQNVSIICATLVSKAIFLYMKCNSLFQHCPASILKVCLMHSFLKYSKSRVFIVMKFDGFELASLICVTRKEKYHLYPLKISI